MNKTFVRVVALIIAVLLALGLLSPLLSFATEGAVAEATTTTKSKADTAKEALARAEAAKKEYLALQSKLDDINKGIAASKTQKEKEQAAKASITQQLNIVKTQVELLLQSIEEQQAELAATQLELDQKKLEMEKTDELFRQRVRAMYISRNSGTISTLLTANSFSEFLTGADALRRVSVADTDLLQKLLQEKKDIEAQEIIVAEKLADLENQRAALEAKKDDYAVALKVSNDKLSTIEAQSEAAQLEYEKLFPLYQAKKDEMNAEMAAAAAAGANTPYVGGAYLWPVPNFYYISSPFGWRTLYGKPDNHIGIDIAGGGTNIYGASIVAANAGTVSRAVYSGVGYGNYVIIDHGGGQVTLYGHCSSLAVSQGQYVEKGQHIAGVGSTGNSTGNHLHFEIRISNVAQNPINYLKG